MARSQSADGRLGIDSLNASMSETNASSPYQQSPVSTSRNPNLRGAKSFDRARLLAEQQATREAKHERGAPSGHRDDEPGWEEQAVHEDLHVHPAEPEHHRLHQGSSRSDGADLREDHARLIEYVNTSHETFNTQVAKLQTQTLAPETNAKTHKDTRGGHSRGGATCPASTTDPDAASHCRCFSPGNCVGGDDERCRGPYRKLHCTAAPSPPET